MARLLLYIKVNIKTQREMDYKQELIELLERVSNDGLEGAIPTLIHNAIMEANFKHNTNENMLYFVGSCGLTHKNVLA